MERLWLISNAQSGSTSDAKCEAILSICDEKGLYLAGHSRFPDDDLPGERQLDDAGVDTLLLFAGDGTINACLCSLANWQGNILILPGGTMNLLAKALHGDRSVADIIHDAHAAPRHISRPFVEAGAARAFVAVILGPAAHWADVREAARKGIYNRIFRFTMRAWRRTFGRPIHIDGVTGMEGGYQAIFVSPAEGGMQVAAVDARDWRSIVELGWEWLRGDWVAARSVEQRHAGSFQSAGRRPVQALFDGEPVRLDPGTRFVAGQSGKVFLTTIGPAESAV